MADEVLIHATAVAFERRALLILGPSGSGKSALALQLMALGAGLIADDQTRLHIIDGTLIASCPPAIRGRIEARGIGILAATPAPPAPVVLAVDLGKPETARLPPPRKIAFLGQEVPLLHVCDSGHFPAALVQYLKGGVQE